MRYWKESRKEQAMNEQPELFGAVPFPPDPGGKHTNHYVQAESVLAYQNFIELRATEREERILAYLDGQGWDGSTDEEGWMRLGYPTPNSYAPCRTGLKAKGLVVWRGDHRRTRSGNSAKVWVTAYAWVAHHRGPTWVR